MSIYQEDQRQTFQDDWVEECDWNSGVELYNNDINGQGWGITIQKNGGMKGHGFGFVSCENKLTWLLHVKWRKMDKIKERVPLVLASFSTKNSFK